MAIFLTAKNSYPVCRLQLSTIGSHLLLAGCRGFQGFNLVVLGASINYCFQYYLFAATVFIMSLVMTISKFIDIYFRLC